jgi:hypothetical protein
MRRILSLTSIVLLSGCAAQPAAPITSQAVSEISRTVSSSQASIEPPHEGQAYVNQDCSKDWIRYDLPSTTQSVTRGEITFDSPYNPSWASATPHMEAVNDIDDATFSFGYPRVTLTAFSGCGYERDFYIKETDARTAAAVEADYEKTYPVDPKDVTIETIGTNTVVVMHNVQGACPTPMIEVIGHAKNHVFFLSCDANSTFKDPLGELEKVVKTVKLK